MRPLQDWKDALCWNLVCSILDDGADPVAACRDFEARYFELSADDLLQVRERGLEVERSARVLAVLKETAPKDAAA